MNNWSYAPTLGKVLNIPAGDISEPHFNLAFSPHAESVKMSGSRAGRRRLRFVIYISAEYEEELQCVKPYV